MFQTKKPVEYDEFDDTDEDEEGNNSEDEESDDFDDPDLMEVPGGGTSLGEAKQPKGIGQFGKGKSSC